MDRAAQVVYSCSMDISSAKTSFVPQPQPQLTEADRPAAEAWSVVYRLSPDGGLWSVNVLADTPDDAVTAVRWWAQHHHDAPMMLVVGVVRLETVR